MSVLYSCPDCGHILEGKMGNRFCEHCGYKSNTGEHTCPRCGVITSDRLDFVSCIACGYKSFKTERVQVDWKRHGWTAAGQIKKILEEVGEIAEALVNGDLTEASKETLDVKQTCDTMLAILAYDWEQKYNKPYPLKRFEQEHVEKLERKGYL